MISYLNKKPNVKASSKIFEGAKVIGDVTIGEYVGVWYNSVLRGDMAPITIGDYTNIQDGTIIHTDQSSPTVIGSHVTIGHQAIIHAATVHDHALIGMGAIILDKAVIGAYALVGAGTVVPPGKTVPEKTLVMGNPMKIIRTLKDEEISAIKANKDHYVKLLKDYSN
ncbi:MAG: gamma carbonic anhydrase family protein [Candidatus Izemoplasmataceae bacterium]